MLVLTLVVTFLLVVGLAVAVLLSVAATPLRRRGSRTMARLDVLAGDAEQRLAPVVERVRRAAGETVRRGQDEVAARRRRDRAHQH